MDLIGIYTRMDRKMVWNDCLSFVSRKKKSMINCISLTTVLEYFLTVVLNFLMITSVYQIIKDADITHRIISHIL